MEKEQLIEKIKNETLFVEFYNLKTEILKYLAPEGE